MILIVFFILYVFTHFLQNIF